MRHGLVGGIPLFCQIAIPGRRSAASTRRAAWRISLISAPDSSSRRSRIVGQCRTGTTSRCATPRCSRVTRMAASSLRRRMVYGFSP